MKLNWKGLQEGGNLQGSLFVIPVVVTLLPVNVSSTFQAYIFI